MAGEVPPTHCDRNFITSTSKNSTSAFPKLLCLRGSVPVPRKLIHEHENPWACLSNFQTFNFHASYYSNKRNSNIWSGFVNPNNLVPNISHHLSQEVKMAKVRLSCAPCCIFSSLQLFKASERSRDIILRIF